jgi:hypothetical protein
MNRFQMRTYKLFSDALVSEKSLYVIPKETNMTTQIGLCYFSDIIPDEIVNEFVAAVSAPRLSLSVEREEVVPIQAGLTWLAPTALIVFLAKPYFQSFLSEMGKDHYNLLKKALKELASRLLSHSCPKIHLIQSSGKTKSHAEYSLAFSIWLEVSEKLRIKLLFPVELEEKKVHEIIEAYSSFIEALYTGQIDERLVQKLRDGRVIGKIMLIAYNDKTKEIDPVDPVPRTS